MARDPKNPNALPRRFHGQEIRSAEIEGRLMFCARDLGRALNYGADGGNLSRNFAHVEAWREAFVEGEDFAKDERGRIWLTPHGVLQTLRLIVATDRREDRAALADEMLRRWIWNERRRRAA